MACRMVVCTHKAYEMPADEMYLPLQVGAAIHEPILDRTSVACHDGTVTASYLTSDDTGENISDKNDTFCELTGLYWAWKNLDSEAIGLCHYRRHFTVKSASFIRHFGWMRACLTRAEAKALLLEYDVVVPGKRRYYIETLFTHYAHTFDESHLILAKEIIKKRHPEYLPYVDWVYGQTYGYMFNMFLAKREYMEDYCAWLFDILFDMERQMRESGGLSGLSSFEKRLFGRVSEILFNVWLAKKKEEGCNVGEIGFLATEREQWSKKIPAFLAAKFVGKKYKESFG